MSDARIPTATYRLQFHGGFRFRDALEIVDYLQELGISDVYSSPYFQASAGSTHGYDVADHNQLSPDIGSESDYRELSSALRQRGMGHILDFVPNHMGIAESLNQWWMDVLEEGFASPFAPFFDIDWHPAKKVLSHRVVLPILGDRYGKVLEEGHIKLEFDGGAFFVRYGDRRLPVNPASYPLILNPAADFLGTAAGRLRELAGEFRRLAADPTGKDEAKSRLAALAGEHPNVCDAVNRALRTLEGKPGEPETFDRLHDFLEAQAYRLSYWRVAAEELNYRRFFDISTLVAIRVEVPQVFEAAHRFVFELLARGDVTGLRIDHIDGLWNPMEYLDRIQTRYAELRGSQRASQEKPLYLIVEKILDLTHEHLPTGWPVHGTTGYEFANQMVQIFTASRAEKRMTRIYQRFSKVSETFADLAHSRKLLTMQIAFAGELSALGRSLDELSEMHRRYRDFTANTLSGAVREVMACFPVYRTYGTPEAALSEDEERFVLRAISAARRRNPSIEKPVFDFLRNVLLMRFPDYLTPEQKDAHVRFVMQFQQCSGPVMAKGVEDTAFYNYNRLVALNEVGGDPGLFGIKSEEFHRLNRNRLRRFPHSMLATSTHDTKRSEDVRMRITVLSEIPEEWERALRAWSRMNKRHRELVDDEWAPSRNEEYLLYQILLGTWPLEENRVESLSAFVERIQQYMMKAVKEAKVNSSWTEPNEEWETAVSAFVSAILDPAGNGEFVSSLSTLAEKVAQLGAMNSLAQVVVKCTAPGVPDFYQGTELWDDSLVDPDNRRPVDFAQRRRLLWLGRSKSPSELLKDWRTGAIKMMVIQRLLIFRRDNSDLFAKGGYRKVQATGFGSKHVIAYLRECGAQRLLVVVPRLTSLIGVWPLADCWGQTRLVLDSGPGSWIDLLSGMTSSLDENPAVSAILSTLPVAVLHHEG